MRQPAQDVFKPTPSRTEAKVDATTKAVRQIIAAESAERVAKTKRLRATRREKEAAKPAAAAPTRRSQRKP